MPFQSKDTPKWRITLQFTVNRVYLFFSFSLSQVVNLLYALAIYISYALNAYVPIQMIKEDNMDKHLEDSKWKIGWEYLLRFAFVIGTSKEN